MNKQVRIATIAVLWTVSVALGVGGTTYESTGLMYWGLMSALVACIVTGHLVAVCAVRNERLRIEGLVEGIVAEARRRLDDGVDHIH